MFKITYKELADFAIGELERGAESEMVARQLASYLLENRQSREVTKVLRAIEMELNNRGQSQVEITSVNVVSEEVKIALASLLDAENPVFSETTDPSVIGGVKARSGEKQIDLTVRNKLDQFKAEIMRSN